MCEPIMRQISYNSFCVFLEVLWQD